MDKVIGHSSETARRYYQIHNREQDARSTLEVASILSPSALTTPTAMPRRLQAVLDADFARGPLPTQAVTMAGSSDTSWATLDWGSGRPSDENDKRGVWTEEEIKRIGIETNAIRSRFSSNYYTMPFNSEIDKIY